MTEISLDIAGLSKALEMIGDLVIPWRRKYSQEMAKLAVEEKQLGNEELQLDLLAKEKGQRLQAIELEERRLALEERKLALHKAKIQLALDVLDRVNPNLPETEKIGYVIQLLEPLGIIVSSPHEITNVTRVTLPSGTRPEN